MITETAFCKIDEMPLKITLYGTLREFKIIAENLDKRYQHPQQVFLETIQSAINEAETIIKKDMGNINQ